MVGFLVALGESGGENKLYSCSPLVLRDLFHENRNSIALDARRIRAGPCGLSCPECMLRSGVLGQPGPVKAYLKGFRELRTGKVVIQFFSSGAAPFS